MGEAAEMVRGFLATAEAMEIFARPSSRVELWRERAFDVEIDGSVVSGVFDRVRFAGFIPQDEFKACYRDASLVAVSFVWPEPIATIGLEVMRYGLPVVAFNAGDIPGWLHDNETGRLVPWGDVPAYAAAMRRLKAMGFSDARLAKLVSGSEVGVRAARQAVEQRGRVQLRHRQQRGPPGRQRAQAAPHGLPAQGHAAAARQAGTARQARGAHVEGQRYSPRGEGGGRGLERMGSSYP
jgi:hypothetical protein